MCVNFELRPGAGDIHICWFNFDALAQENAYKPTKEPINYRGPSLPHTYIQTYLYTIWGPVVFTSSTLPAKLLHKYTHLGTISGSVVLTHKQPKHRPHPSLSHAYMLIHIHMHIHIHANTTRHEIVTSCVRIRHTDPTSLYYTRTHTHTQLDTISENQSY